MKKKIRKLIIYLYLNACLDVCLLFVEKIGNLDEIKALFYLLIFLKNL